MQPVATDRVAWLVCQFVTTMSPSKMDEPIVMQVV